MGYPIRTQVVADERHVLIATDIRCVSPRVKENPFIVFMEKTDD
jgi:hypothetical protein